MIGRPLLALVLAAGLVAGCGPRQPPPVTPAAPVKAGPEIGLTVEPVPLDASNPARTSADGGFAYAGGLVLTSADTTRLHGLSDLAVGADGQLTAISDEGDVFEARIQLDPAGRLVGLTDGKLRPLPGLDGQPLQGKQQGDAEGLAILPSGDRLISFERDHRIWLYPVAPDGSWGTPRRVPKPATVFPDNEGMEALSAYPAAGPDAFLVGGEEGEVWFCRLSGDCKALPPQSGPDFTWGLTAMAAFDGAAVATLHRGFDPVRGWRAIVRFISDPALPAARQRASGHLRLEGPLVRGNFEGLALTRSPSGGTRVYLLSDDGAPGDQRTLLLAFDWTPPPPPPPPPAKPVRKKPVRKR